jgi:hypothetical protein
LHTMSGEIFCSLKLLIKCSRFNFLKTSSIFNLQLIILLYSCYNRRFSWGQNNLHNYIPKFLFQNLFFLYFIHKPLI